MRTNKRIGAKQTAITLIDLGEDQHGTTWEVELDLTVLLDMYCGGWEERLDEWEIGTVYRDGQVLELSRREALSLVCSRLDLPTIEAADDWLDDQAYAAFDRGDIDLDWTGGCDD